MQSRSRYQIETGISRPVYGARDRIKREAHALVIQTTDGETAKAKQDALWVTDLRRGRLNIYGSLLRFIDGLARRGVPMDVALLIPQMLEAYIRDVFGDRPSEQASIGVRKVG